MSTNIDSIVGEVTRLVEPVIEDLGFELVDVEYLAQGGRWVLRVYADREGGITLNDCALVSREIGDLLDVEDIIQHEYVLEVSSPGLDRPLKKERDFLRAVGKKIKVRMIHPIGDRRNFTGYLRRMDNDTLHLETTEGLCHLPFGDVEKANLIYEFEK